jgi:hypothetical protein
MTASVTNIIPLRLAECVETMRTAEKFIQGLLSLPKEEQQEVMRGGLLVLQQLFRLQIQEAEK